jgi:hypothetical protein
MIRPHLQVSLLLAVASSSCAALDTERNLAPLYSEHWTAGGGVGVEALGGVILTHRPSIAAELDSWAIRPLFIHDWTDDASHTEFLHPFGTVTREGDEFTWALLPLARYSRDSDPVPGDDRDRDDAAGAASDMPDGFVAPRYSLLILPFGLYFAQFPSGSRVRAAFPFVGVMDGFITFDRMQFVLFPLYLSSERDNLRTWHFLFPIFSYSKPIEVTAQNKDDIAWRVWPLVGHDARAGRYDRWYFLWPIFQFQRNELRLGPANEELSWTIFPLFGRTEQGSFRSTSVLWPFFGYAHDPANGFRSLDLPWPLVSFQDPGTSDRARRFRIWPFYSKYEGDGMVSRSWAWPLVHHRVETYPDGVRSAFSVLPFYQSTTRHYDDVAEPTHWQKLWPLWQHEEGPDHVRSALPALSPLWRTPDIDRHYGWLWELYSHEERDGLSHSRGWLGLWRREAGKNEIRTTMTGAWSRRTYRSEGVLIHETSLLFGLIRWRNSAVEGTSMLAPAMPGPGWPLRHSTELLELPSGPPTTTATP